MWVLVASGDDAAEDMGYVNLDQVLRVGVALPAYQTKWRIQVTTPGEQSYLKALYDTKADALEAARRVVRGVDPTT